MRRKRSRHVADDFAGDLRELRERVARLEQRIAEVEGRRSAEASLPHAAPAAVVVPAPSAPVVPAAGPARSPRSAEELERRVGANWLGRAGMLVFVLGIGFFVKYAIDNEWIGLVARIWLGVLGGIVLVVVSELLLRTRRYGVYPDILAAGGLVLAYFSVFAAYHFEPYRAAIGIGAAADVALLALVAAGAVGLALRRDSPALAGQGFALGYVTVFLAENAASLALPYAVLLAAGLAGVAAWRRWTLVGLGGILGGYVTSFAVFWRGPDPLLYVFAVSTYFVAFTAFAAASAARKPFEAALAAMLNGGLFLGVMLMAFSSGSFERVFPDAVDEVALVVGLVHVALAAVAWTRGAQMRALGLSFATVAAAALVAWAPLAFDGPLVTLVWAGVAAAATLLASRAPASPARFVAVVLLALLAVRAGLYDPDEVVASPLRTLGMVVAAGVLGLGWRLLKGTPERNVDRVALAAAVGVALAILAADLDGTAVSVSWAVLAGAVLGAGFLARESDLRFAGLGAFGVTLVRIFGVDLAQVEVITRVITFVFVGAALLVVSYFYSRRGRAPG